jgi:hypothetical protein
MIVFDISGVDEEIRPAMNVLVTGLLGSRFRTDLDKETIIVVDEARVFLRNPHLSTFLLDTVAMGRSYGIALWLITQNPGDLAKNGVEEEFRTNMPLSIVMGATLDPAKVEPIKKFFNLSQTAVDDLLQCEQGEGLLLLRGEEIPLRFEPTPHEYQVIKGKYETKRPSPVVGFECGNILPEFGPLIQHHGIILKKWVDGDDSFLVADGWKKKSKLPDIKGRGSCVMWHRPGAIKDNLMHIETLGKKLGKMTVNHFAIAVQIESYLVERKVKCSSDHNQGPDLIFEAGGKTYAIEIEMARSHTDLELIQKKDRLSGYDDFKFVCMADDYGIISKSVTEDSTVTIGKDLITWLDSLIEEPSIQISKGEKMVVEAQAAL